jgi:hypothetical protein
LEVAMAKSGCDFVSSETNTQIHKSQLRSFCLFASVRS